MLTKDFIAAGKAIFTVAVSEDFQSKSKTVKPHYTYKVRYKPANGKFGESWFVSLLTGPENTSDFTYLGMLDAGRGLVRLTKGSKFNDDSWPVKILRRVLACLWASEGDKIEAAGWMVHHEGKCGRCGRRLTVPESITSGIGPECAKIMGRMPTAAEMDAPEDD